MKYSKIIIRLFILFVVLQGLVWAESAEQATKKWSINIEPLWIVNSGNDIQIGNIYSLKNTIQDGNNSSSIYDYKLEPLMRNMKNKFTLRLEVIRKIDKWGIGGSYWWLATDDLQEGKITTPPSVTTPTGSIIYENSIELWNTIFRPTMNVLEESGKSPIDYSLKNNFKVRVIDFFGTRTLAEHGSSGIDMSFGVKFGSLTNETSDFIKQRYYAGETGDNPRFYDDAHISLESNTKSDAGFFIGPALGFQGNLTHKRLYVSCSVNQSILRTSVKQDSTFVHSWDEKGQYDSNQWSNYWKYNYVIAKEKVEYLPQTELKIRLLIDVAKNLSFGITNFTLLWWNAPLAPTWDYRNYGSDIIPVYPHRTLYFYGIAASITLHF